MENTNNSNEALTKLELEKNDLERKIATPGMGAGAAIVWIILIFIISNLCRLLFVMMIGHPEFWSDPETYCIAVPPAIIGFVVLAIVFAKSNNKSGLEEKLKNINLQIAQLKDFNPDIVSVSNSKRIPPASPSVSNLPSTEILEKELRRIKKLLDDGLITEEEYQDLRKKVMK